MERKGGSTTVAVTAEDVRAALPRARVTSEEEKALRMRHGVAADTGAALPRAAGNNAELGDELLLIEMQLLRAFRARTRVRTEATSRVSTGRNAPKEKIVRALRKKN